MTADAQRPIALCAGRDPSRVFDLWYVNRAGARFDGALTQALDERQHRLRVMVVGTDVIDSGTDEHRPSADRERCQGNGSDKAGLRRVLHVGLLNDDGSDHAWMDRTGEVIGARLVELVG